MKPYRAKTLIGTQLRVNTRDENGIVQPLDPKVAEALAEVSRKLVDNFERTGRWPPRSTGISPDGKRMEGARVKEKEGVR